MNENTISGLFFTASGLLYPGCRAIGNGTAKIFRKADDENGNLRRAKNRDEANKRS